MDGRCIKPLNALLVCLLLLPVGCGTRSAMTDEVVKADTELKDGAPQAALELLRHRLVEYPNDPRTLTELGKVNAAMGRKQAATIFFEQALEHQPHSLEATKGLARIKLQTNPPQATVLLQQMVKRYPRDAQAWIDLGVSYDLQGQYKSAQDAYREAMRIDPMMISAQSNLGLSYAFSGQYSQALDLLGPLASSAETSNPKLRANFALAQYLAGYKDTARKTLMQDMSETQADAVLASFAKFGTPADVAQ